MIVKVNGQDYLVGWRHLQGEDIVRTFGHALNAIPGGGNAVGVTECTVYELHPSMGDKTSRVAVAVGYASCSPKEQFCKEKGRKVSLAKALGKLHDYFGAEVRKMFWETYFNRLHGKPIEKGSAVK